MIINNKKMRKYLTPILILGLMIVAMPTMAAEWYVKAGETGSTCTESDPCGDLMHTFDYVQDDGDTLMIAGTHSYSDFRTLGRTGTADSLHTFQQWEGEVDAVIEVENGFTIDNGGHYFVFDGITFSGSNKANVIAKGDNLTFTDCAFVGAEKAGLVITSESSAVSVSGSSFNSNAQDGDVASLEIYGDNVSIIANKVHDSGASSIVFGSGETILIANNYFYNSTDATINIGGTVDGLDIYNNSFYENEANPLIYVPSDFAGGAIELKNNIFHSSVEGASIYEFQADYNSLTSDNNLFYTPEYSDLMFSDRGDYYTLSDWQAVGYDANSIEDDPLYVDVVNGDYHVQKDSPAIDAGDTLEEITNDYDGDVRPLGKAYDIGADEYPVVIDEDETDYVPAKKVKKLKVKKKFRKKKKVRVTWKKHKYKTILKLQKWNKKKKKYKKYKTYRVKKNKKKKLMKQLKPGTKYRVRARKQRTVSGTKYYSDWTKWIQFKTRE